MYYLYRYIDVESNVAVKIMTLHGYPSNQEEHYKRFNRTYAYVKGRKTNTIVIKPFNVLCVPAPRPKGHYSMSNHVNDHTTLTCIRFIQSQPLHTNLSKIDITTIYPELFI